MYLRNLAPVAVPLVLVAIIAYRSESFRQGTVMQEDPPRHGGICCAGEAPLHAEPPSDEKKDAESGKKKPAKFYDPVEKDVEGWTLAVDPQLLAEENRELKESAFKALANHLQRVKYIVSRDKVKALQKLRIWIELDNPKLGNMQYHPSKGWLVSNGHDPRLVKHVHIPRARSLLSRRQWAKHPYVVLHELAHAYHDQVMGFDQPDIVAAHRDAREKGIYESVLLFTGKKVKHYALTNHKEYFAESTEAYFGVNDFYPFVRAELKEHDPKMFDLMKRFWGPIQ